MKRLLLAVTFVVMSVASAQASIGNAIWNAIKSSSSDRKVEPVQIEIEVAGNNARGYVVYVEEMKATCFIVWGSSDSPVMECKTLKEMGVNEENKQENQKR